jgi:hypothetical protein
MRIATSRLRGLGLVDVLGVLLTAGFFLLDGASVEEFDQRRAVVRGDEREELGGQVVFLGQCHAVLDVADDDEHRHIGIERVVPVGSAALIFDEILGLVDLAHVVVVGAHAGQQ